MKAFQAIVSALVAPAASESVLATLATVEGSSCRRPGARLPLTATGQRLGSISGGCLEEDVLLRARRVLATGLAAPAATTQRPPSKAKIAVDFGAEQVAQAKPTTAGDELHTTIEGTVQEFSGRAVFVLGNGQIWQRRTPTDVFLPRKLVNPAVTLIRGAFGYKRVVDAADLVLLVKCVQQRDRNPAPLNPSSPTPAIEVRLRPGPSAPQKKTRRNRRVFELEPK